MTSTDTTPESVTRTEVISAEQVESFAGLVGLDPASLPKGEVPEMWHLMYLVNRPPTSEIGPDGHPTTGLPAPAEPGMRRMFAGGRVTTYRRLRIGEEATRTTKVISSVTKEGRSGKLLIVTVRSEFTQGGELAIAEEQDIVYRAPGGGSLPRTVPSDEPLPEREGRIDLAVDEPLLFRFSALTYNAHRIHYDHNWARHEGYDDLVIHGPLQAILMSEVARRAGVDLAGREFAYRLVSPAVGPQTVAALAAEEGVEAGAETRSAAGTVTATSTWTKPE